MEEAILRVHANNIKLAANVDVRAIAKGTPGFSGADLANLINEGALLTAKLGKNVVTIHELEEAKDKIIMGSARKSLKMKEFEREMTAYHESGHAIVAMSLPDSDPVHKITIMPRGRALGLVSRLPEDDRYSISMDKLKADLAVAMAGRAAEVEFFGEAKSTTGASSDIEQATKMARSMVLEWGMSKKIGPVNHAGDSRDVYGGKQNTYHASEATAKEIDAEVRKLIEEGMEKAYEIIKKRKDDMHLLSKTLLEHETLSGEEITELFEKRAFEREVEQLTSSNKRKSGLHD